MEHQITAIKAQKRNRDRLNIELDGEFAFGLSRMVAAWLKVGDFLSEEKINSLRKADDSEAAYQKALRLLDFRERTAQEIRQKLELKGYLHEDVERVMERLQHAGLVQDQEFARSWVENRNELHPRSQRMIRYELKNKGIEEQIIDSALEGCAQDEELARKAAIRYARRLDVHDKELFRKRLIAHLARRGFSYGTILPITQSLIQSLELQQSTNSENKDVEYGTF